jgi:hypothetical protein
LRDGAFKCTLCKIEFQLVWFGSVPFPNPTFCFQSLLGFYFRHAPFIYSECGRKTKGCLTDTETKESSLSRAEKKMLELSSDGFNCMMGDLPFIQKGRKEGSRKVFFLSLKFKVCTRGKKRFQNAALLSKASVRIRMMSLILGANPTKHDFSNFTHIFVSFSYKYVLNFLQICEK